MKWLGAALEPTPKIPHVGCMAHAIFWLGGMFRDQANDFLSFLYVNCNKKIL